LAYANPLLREALEEGSAGGEAVITSHAQRSAARSGPHIADMEDDAEFAAASSAARAGSGTPSARPQPTRAAPQPSSQRTAGSQRTPAPPATPPASKPAPSPSTPPTPPSGGKLHSPKMARRPRPIGATPPTPTRFQLVANVHHKRDPSLPEDLMQWSDGTWNGVERWLSLSKWGTQRPPPEGWSEWHRRNAWHRRTGNRPKHPAGGAQTPPPFSATSSPPGPATYYPIFHSPSYAAAARARPAPGGVASAGAQPPLASTSVAPGAIPSPPPADQLAQILSALHALTDRLTAVERAGLGPPATGPRTP
jgi:hypothetical protein